MTIADQQRTRLMTECEAMLTKLVESYRGVEPTCYWSGKAYVDVQRKTLFRMSTTCVLKQLHLAGWRFDSKVPFGVLEDGSFFHGGTITRRKIFSGELKSRESGIFRFEVTSLSTSDLADLRHLLTLYGQPRLN